MPQLVTPQRLQRAISRGFDRVENFRKARYMFMEEYVGAFYDRADPGRATPLNLIFKAVSILVPHLVAKNPQSDIRSRFSSYLGYAEMLSLAADDVCEEIDLAHTLRLTIIDAIFGMGIIKTGQALANQTWQDPDGMGVNMTQPYADRVDLDDLLFDPVCRDLREASIIGNRVRVRRSFLQESGLYDPDLIERLPGIMDNDIARGKEVSRLSLGKNRRDRDINDLDDYVDLVETWVRDDNVIVTTPFGDKHLDDYLRVVDYDGPDSENGPYHFLGFHWAPNNPFPVPPAGIWYDLHVMANDHAAKAERQARRSKEVLVYGRVAADDAQEIVDADDGDSVAVDNPDQVKSVRYGGAMDDVYKHLGWIDMKFAESGPGDFNQLGGEVSNADTATQANILQAAATIRVGDMKDIIYSFTSKVVKDIVWYIHTDPLIEKPLAKRLPGGEQITMILTPEARKGDFLDFTFKIKSESMERENPTMRSQKLTQFVQTVVPTAIQTFLQLHAVGLGHFFNFVKFISINAKLQQIDNFDAVWGDPEFQITLGQAMQQAMMMQAQSVGMVGPGRAGPSPDGSVSIKGGGAGVVPRYQGAGLDPMADPSRALAQMGSAPAQSGAGNLSGRPGGGLPGV